jgi:hypothetical protein
MQLNLRHVTADAIAILALVTVSTSRGVASLATSVIKRRIIPAGVLMRCVASQTAQLAGCEAAAFR